ncbi:MAG TPA: archaeosortase A [Thermoplasmata archaeon]|jgi:archaeosortase A (PGF-CTERM-specific)|nr:archaeosortase A [Thermoplasmata archaeon]
MGLALDAILFTGLALFGIGAFWRDRRCHLARAAGWALFGVFWFVQVPTFLNQGDPVNSLGAAVALPVFLFFAYHEDLSYRWNEEYQPLRFLAVGAFWAAGIYFLVDRIPVLAGTLIDVVAHHTAGLLGVFASGYSVGPVDYATGPEIFAPILSDGAPVVNIILACTAIQGITITAALVPGTSDPWKRKGLVLAILVPATYVMNVVRNVVVIYFFNEAGENWEFVHNGYGKGLSFLVLMVLMLVAFWLLPELYLNLNGVFELPWRKRPGHDYKKHVGRLLGKIARPKAVEKKLQGPAPGPEGGPRRPEGRRPEP